LKYQGFIDAIRSANLTPPAEIVADGTLKRFASNGNPRDTAGWYVLHDDGFVAGVYGCHRQSIQENWHEKSYDLVDDVTRRAFQARIERARDESRAAYEKDQKEAAVTARRLISQSTKDAPHPYLDRKGILPHGTYVHPVQGLLVPMHDGEGQIVNVERIPIDAKEVKKGLPSGRRKGCFFPIGDEITDTILIAEGFSTGASVHEATGYMTFVAFSAGNLKAVYAYVSEHFPDKRIIIAADNDQFTDGNPGLKAAQETGCTYVYPEFPSISGNPTDFNDLHAIEGIDAVRESIEKQLSEPIIDINAGEPFDLFSQMDPPEFCRGMLPTALENYVFDQAEVMGTDPSIFAMGCIVACASAIDAGIKIQVKISDPSWTESARLWGAVVGDPSIKKTPALSRAIAPLKKINFELTQGNEKEDRSYKAMMAQFKKAMKTYDPDLGAPEEPEAPKKKRTIVEDATIEALGEILKDNERGVLIFMDELARWFGAMDAYRQGGSGSKDRGNYLELYNGHSKPIDRIGRGSISVPMWGACMLGAIQPSSIKQELKQAPMDGLIQRFMIAIGQKRPYSESNRAPVKDYSDAYHDLIRSLHAAGYTESTVKMSPEADVVRSRLFAFAHRMTSHDIFPDSFKSHLSKWEGLFPRLCLTFHAVESLSDTPKHHPVNQAVSRATAERVEAFMKDFLFHHEYAFYTDVLGVTEQGDHARWIAGHILAHGLKIISRSDIKRVYKRWDSLHEWIQEATMRCLEDANWISSADLKGNQKRLQKWIVNQRVHDMYVDQAEKELRIRKERMEGISELTSMRSRLNNRK